MNYMPRLLSGLLISSILSACQSVQQMHIVLPLSDGAAAQPCEVLVSGSLLSQELRACGFGLRQNGGTSTMTSDDGWNFGIVAHSVQHVTSKFNFSIQLSDTSVRSWSCVKRRINDERHVARVFWNQKFSGEIICTHSSNAKLQRLVFRSSEPHLVTWETGATGETWQWEPKTRVIADGRDVNFPTPMGWCAYLQGKPIGCRDWLSARGRIWQYPVADEETKIRLMTLALAQDILWDKR